MPTSEDRRSLPLKVLTDAHLWVPVVALICGLLLLRTLH
jgi:hypothetical protein